MGLEMSPSDKRFSKNIFTKLLTNFAKSSVPTPELTDHITLAWKPRPTTGPVYTLTINSKLRQEPDYLAPRIRFWNETVANMYAESTNKQNTKKKSKKQEL